MRTSEEILDDARNDIITTGVDVPKALWLEYRKLEVLIDSRDELSRISLSLLDVVMSLKNKD